MAMYNPYDFYFKQAKKQGFKARSAFKLDEIQEKFHCITKNTKAVIDIGCAPGSRLQYTQGIMLKMGTKNPLLIGFDIKPVTLNLPGVYTYVQDVTDQEAVQVILQKHTLQKVDFIQSDMAPNTTGIKDLDAMRSMELIKHTLRMYKTLLSPQGTFAIKVFMGPGFQEFVAELKSLFGGKQIKIYKPKACRSESKETYIIKI